MPERFLRPTTDGTNSAFSRIWSNLRDRIMSSQGHAEDSAKDWDDGPNDSEVEFIYLRFVLPTTTLPSYVRSRLERLGVECLDEGAEHEAFGVVQNDDSILFQISEIPDILCVEMGDPPSGK